MPVMVTGTLPISSRTENALGTVSVVMIASAALAQLSECTSARAAGSPAAIRSSGKGSMITPVEKGKTCSGDRFKARASATQVACARRRPSCPVPALALPVLTNMARMPWLSPEFLARCSRQICTGAAQNLFCVNTAPTDAPSSSSKTARSLRWALRMPACAMPQRTPGTG